MTEPNGFLPTNWNEGKNGWHWTPPKEVAPSTQVKMKRSDSVEPESNAVARLLRTRPLLTNWRDYWTDGGKLDCGGWHMRMVQGFHEDNE